jgi:hypothetical protein
MNFKRYIIETHLKNIEYKIVQDADGKFKINFFLKGAEDAELRKHAAAHAAMEMNRLVADDTFETEQQAIKAATQALDAHRDNNMGYTKGDIEEEAPANSVGSGENIAGINPPAGPAPLTDRNLRGVAAGMTPEQLAKKHRTSVDKILKQLELGMQTEMEHTQDRKVAYKIAMDHIFEDPKYYNKLSKMEGKKPYDIGNNTKFNPNGDPLAKYRVTMMQTRRTTTNQPGAEKI